MAISVKKITTKSTPTPTSVVIRPLSATGTRERRHYKVLVVGFELRAAY